ncbi:molybdopterin-dependent oxidoreductase [Natronococcus jeotgali]|uniref:Oxidoreductase molybdopterin binding protein n=1 Tax=Natronococcus jeotgali DSM 18795 TaxID=1227498 RepID=L9X3K9_9EURY|nr:molybdopterin-dependent oxidoreductase [Natronococcus jeotgali]ELY55168.1 oxidoreductase molybdopterin binding protein [Natronococcus jeotgali DSM 18795]
MSVPPEPALERPIRLVGSRQRRLEGADLAALERTSREIEIVCATGDRFVERWRGVPIPSLLEVAEAPPETTHLLVDARDGLRACVPVETALEGLLAVAKGGRPLAEDGEYATRFVAPGVDGVRTVKGVARIETTALAPGVDPEDRERRGRSG